jgi:hypothetical protein
MNTLIQFDDSRLDILGIITMVAAVKDKEEFIISDSSKEVPHSLTVVLANIDSSLLCVLSKRNHETSFSFVQSLRRADKQEVSARALRLIGGLYGGGIDDDRVPVYVPLRGISTNVVAELGMTEQYWILTGKYDHAEKSKLN